MYNQQKRLIGEWMFNCIIFKLKNNYNLTYNKKKKLKSYGYIYEKEKIFLTFNEDLSSSNDDGGFSLAKKLILPQLSDNPLLKFLLFCLRGFIPLLSRRLFSNWDKGLSLTGPSGAIYRIPVFHAPGSFSSDKGRPWLRTWEMTSRRLLSSMGRLTVSPGV